MTCVLDTHIWIWWQLGPSRLSSDAAAVLDPAAGNELLLPVICVWEFAKLVEKGRLVLTSAPEEWAANALRMPGLRLKGLTPSLCLASTRLPPPFHSDPADQIIVATAREAGVPVVTADERIRAYPHLATIW